MLTTEDEVRLAHYLDSTLTGAWGVRVANLTLLHFGASRDTYSFDVYYETEAGPVKRGLVLRLDAKGAILDAERMLEIAAFRSVQSANVPAPLPLAVEQDAQHLGAPFTLVERIDDATAASPFLPSPYGIYTEDIAYDFFSILGRIASIEPAGTELAQVSAAPAAGQCWARELDYWERVLRIDALGPQPIVEAAIRRLRRNPPSPPPALSIIHGDFRHGNFLHDGKGRITAVLDWELAHIGDPLEDLAWALDPLWAQGKPELAAGLIPFDQAVGIWRQTSGLDFDPQRFAWWSLFAQVKGMAIWTAAARSYWSGASRDPMRAFTGWYCSARHSQMIAERLAQAKRGALK